MQTELTLNDSITAAGRYLTWAPVPAQVRLAVNDGAVAPVRVTVRNLDTTHGGQVQFGPVEAVAAAYGADIQLDLPVDGTPVALSVKGLFQHPSVEDGDAAIEVAAAVGGQQLSSTPLMVRIRKDANTLTTAERDRFLRALVRFNDPTTGRWRDFPVAHGIASSEAHGYAGFLPWHRAFLLDLERELQTIDPAVSMPYWRFHMPAPRLFRKDFAGLPDPTSKTNRVIFDSTNPLAAWPVAPGIVRSPQFNGQTQSAADARVRRSEQSTVEDRPYAPFRSLLESDPHDKAHTSFTGDLAALETAARDPVFFLLHANVDHLWAVWQWIRQRVDPSQAATYPAGSHQADATDRIGHRLDDTMWPWNGITGGVRPPHAPGGTFPASSLVAAPGLTPTVRSMIDYQGRADPKARLGFDYDDVPFRM